MKNLIASVLIAVTTSNVAIAQTEYTNYNSIMSPKKDSLKAINLHIKKAEKIERVEFVMQVLAVVSLTAISYTYQEKQNLAMFSLPIGLVVGSFIVGGIASREYRKGYNEIGYDY